MGQQRVVWGTPCMDTAAGDDTLANGRVKLQSDDICSLGSRSSSPVVTAMLEPSYLRFQAHIERTHHTTAHHETTRHKQGSNKTITRSVARKRKLNLVDYHFSGNGALHVQSPLECWYAMLTSASSGIRNAGGRSYMSWSCLTRDPAL